VDEIADKQRSKVENLAKYGYRNKKPMGFLLENIKLCVGSRHISNYYFGQKILTILHQTSGNIFK
jgi:hypothetical protein